MDDSLIRRSDAVTEIHKYFVAEIDKTPTVIDEDGDELYADMTTVNSLLACNKELSKRIKTLPSAEAVQGECRTCKRSSDYLWKNGENGTRCPIEEHYALPKDGYCHLHEPYKGGDDE